MYNFIVSLLHEVCTLILVPAMSFIWAGCAYLGWSFAADFVFQTNHTVLFVFLLKRIPLPISMSIDIKVQMLLTLKGGKTG